MGCAINNNCKKNQIILISGIINIFLYVLIYYVLFHFADSYLNTRLELVEKISAQLSGNIPLTEIYGNYHGRIWYIFVASVKNTLGLQTAAQAFELIQLFCFGITLFCFPILLLNSEITNISIVFSGIAVVVLGYPIFSFRTDGGFAGAMSVMICIPLLFGLWKRVKYEKKDWIKLGIVILIAALCNIPRQQSSFAILIVLILLFIVQFFIRVKQSDYLEAFLIIALAFIAFFIINKSDGLLYVFYKTCGGSITLSFVEKPWHSMYIGLGYLSNKYGIVYADECAKELVKSIDSQVTYCSEEYFKILQSAFFDILKNDPEFVILNYVAKFFVALFDCFLLSRGWIIVTIICLYKCATKNNVYHRMRKYKTKILLCVVCMVLGTVQGVLAIPVKAYILPSISAFVLIHIICLNLALKKWMEMQ